MAARAYVFVAMIGLMPDACAKLLGQSPPPAETQTDPAPFVPSATVTAPPTYQPPDPGGPLPSPTAGAVSPELAKARNAAAAGDSKKVRALLKERVRTGKASREEALLLLDACGNLKDKACVDMVRRSRSDLDMP